MWKFDESTLNSNPGSVRTELIYMIAIYGLYFVWSMQVIRKHWSLASGLNFIFGAWASCEGLDVEAETPGDYFCNHSTPHKTSNILTMIFNGEHKTFLMPWSHRWYQCCETTGYINLPPRENSTPQFWYVLCALKLKLKLETCVWNRLPMYLCRYVYSCRSWSLERPNHLRFLYQRIPNHLK